MFLPKTVTDPQKRLTTFKRANGPASFGLINPKFKQSAVEPARIKYVAAWE